MSAPTISHGWRGKHDELFFPEAVFAEIEGMSHIILCIFQCLHLYWASRHTHGPVALFLSMPCDLCVAD